MPTYYKHQKLVTAVNAIEIDRTAAYNGATALTATFAIDNPDGEVEFQENPIYKTQKRGHLDTREFLVGYDIGMINIPNHPLKTGLFLQFGAFTATAATTTYTLTELASGAYEFALHGVMMHTTTAQNLVKDALGCKMKSIHLEWGQTEPLTAAYAIHFAQLVSGNVTARKTTLDAKEAFPAGQFSSKNVYNSSSFGITELGGTLDIDLEHKYNKGGNKYPTEAVYMGKGYNMTIQFMAFNKNLLSIPHNPGSYASAITRDIKWWRTSETTDFIRCSFTNLMLTKPIAVKKIAEQDYIYLGTAEFKNSATSQGTCTIQFADPALSNTLVAM
jgi:hypothetical protein